jgi:hypothetical protein
VNLNYLGVPTVFISTQFKVLRQMLDLQKGPGSRETEFEKVPLSTRDTSLTVAAMMGIIPSLITPLTKTVLKSSFALIWHCLIATQV